MSDDEPQYVAARVQKTLAEDDRTYELGIRVEVQGERLVLRGRVTDDHRRASITRVAQDAAPGMTVDNEITVVRVRDSVEEETL